MKDRIKQVIVSNEMVYLFTENPEKDINEICTAYEFQEEVEPEIPLGYEMPELRKFNFLGKDYPCITLWFDNEDIPDIYTGLVY